MDGRDVKTKHDANQVHKHTEQREMVTDSAHIRLPHFEATISPTQN